VSAVGAELRRVIRLDGVLLVRGFFPDHSEIEWLRAFQDNDAVATRFPTVGQTQKLFVSRGFEAVGIAQVEESHRNAKDVAAWVRRMRAADSILTCYSDDQLAAGLKALDAADSGRALTSQLTLLAFR
jgi:hypothetical protein